MEALFLVVMLVVGLLVAPVVLSIIALLKAGALQRELDELRKQHGTDSVSARPVPGLPAGSKAPPAAEVAAANKAISPKVVPAVAAVSSPANPPSPAVEKKPDQSRAGMEFLIGGKAAAFAGVVILLIGIVFLVGYAIQNSWIGPGFRVLIGLLFGGGLVGLGYGLESKGCGKYGLLARALTGAGSALFYFVVFAAYGFYHLIGPGACGAGLFVSALAVFGLAMVYASQAVGVLGVLGAFITPLLLGGEMEKGIFPLIYVGVINAPVLLLGVRRNWQALYNLAFVLTVLYFFTWLDWIGSGEYAAGLLFALFYFSEFAALGLFKLRCEQKIHGRRVDLIRLLAASLLLLWAVYWVLDQAAWTQWLGLTFLLLALFHMGIAAGARRLLSRFSEDILAFLGGGLLFAVLALPAQLDGEWVSLGWALEGAVLAWFAVRVQSRTLFGAASLLGLIGIGKALFFDGGLYSSVPRVFLNARFVVGMLSCGLLGVQGWLADRFPFRKTEEGVWRDALWWSGIIAGLIVFCADVFWTLGVADAWAWTLICMALFAVGAVLTLTIQSTSSLRLLGALVLAVLPLQIVWFYLIFGSRTSMADWVPFVSPVPWMLLAALGAVVFWLKPRMPEDSPVGPLSGAVYRLMLTLLSLASALFVLTLEAGRIQSEWSGTLVTVLWAVWALTLIIFGLMRSAAPYRIFGLILFGLTTLKVLFVDSSELSGIERIAAFMGAGVFLLILSFVYQKVSARFLSTGDKS